jgi:hypothetical protein
MKLIRIFVANAGALVCLASTAVCSFGQGTPGDVVVRVEDTSGAHCIDATSEKLTLFVRRVFVEKDKNWFTQTNQAGVLVRSQITGQTTPDPSKPDEKVQAGPVQVPAVNMVSVKDEPKGRVSLGLEYPVSSDLVLNQSKTITKTMDLYINLAKAKGRTGFGSILDLAGKALNQLPIPPNPYTQAGSKFLQFANSAIDSSIKTDENEQIAHIGLQFNEGAETDLIKCKSHGNETTGAIAVLREVGIKGAELVPVTDTDKLYCFRYSSGATYELLAARRKTDGTCPDLQSYSGVPNDYVMMLISAQPTNAGTKSVLTPDEAYRESKNRCKLQKLPDSACGIR